MNKLFLLFFLMFFSLNSFSQKKLHHVFLNERKARIKKYLKKYLQENKLTNAPIIETDSTLSIIIKDSALWEARFYYHFAKHNKCDAQKQESNCEVCMEKYLQDDL